VKPKRVSFTVFHDLYFNDKIREWREKMNSENDKMQNRGALAGIRVLDLSRLLPGPYCSMILADHGARVISVEDRRFQAAGHYVATVNRNKEHMTLDLKTVQGKDIFQRLLAQSET
jgi:crotonobetainyl-CoA:carnitine CoA-transferase CaiB-like acyl-CoA transferase